MAAAGSSVSVARTELTAPLLRRGAGSRLPAATLHGQTGRPPHPRPAANRRSAPAAASQWSRPLAAASADQLTPRTRPSPPARPPRRRRRRRLPPIGRCHIRPARRRRRGRLSRRRAGPGESDAPRRTDTPRAGHIRHGALSLLAGRRPGRATSACRSGERRTEKRLQFPGALAGRRGGGGGGGVTWPTAGEVHRLGCQPETHCRRPADG